VEHPTDLHPSADLLRRTRLVELRARRCVEDLLTGPYRSVFRGRGLEFDDLREYQPGDDIRSIDWHATARTSQVQVKRHVEERALTLLVAVDVSASGAFASGPQAKIELASELAATFALSAALNNDRAGLMLFSDRVERFVPPGTGRHHALHLVATLLGHRPQSRATSLRSALTSLHHALRRRATVFLVSDFLDPDPGLERALRIAALRHDLVAVPVHDPAEDSLPDIGWLVVEDAESGEVMEVNTSDPAFRRAHEVQRLARSEQLRDLFRRTGIDAIPCVAGRPWHRALLQFLERRLDRPPPGAAVRVA
jgi:uncharacterized protein (DUF58 family)